MDKKKLLYIVIGVLAAVLVVCLVIALVGKGNDGQTGNQPGTSQATDENGEVIDNGGNESENNNGGNGDSGNNGNSGNSGSGSDTGNVGNTGTGNNGTVTGNDSDIEISIGIEDLLPDSTVDSTEATQGKEETDATEGNTDTQDPTEGTKDPSVIEFKDLLEAGKKGN